jgi:hypothetical protein
MAPDAVGVLGIFNHRDRLSGTIRRLKEAGFTDLMVLSPVPCHEIEQALTRNESPVRVFTLIGGIVGGITGLALTIGATRQWALVTGGKPLMSLPPYLVITFELTILFGALATLLGMFWSMRRPRFTLETYYDPRFSEDRFGIRVLCPTDQLDTVRGILQESGVEEVQREDL